MKMTILVLLFQIIALTFAYDADWSKIKVRDVFVEPKNDNSTKTEKFAASVIGGSESKPHSQPYQVALFLNGNGFCGGSLISTTYVLTAAHCLKNSQNVKVVLGAHKIQEKEGTQVEIQSASLKIHENYNPSTLENDIGIIKLSKAAPINANIQIIKLAKNGDFTGKTALLSGWGKTSSNGQVVPVLNSVQLKVMSNDQCARTYGTIQNSMLCTEGTSGNSPKGSCNGDSGGPLVYQNTQIGIVSFGTKDCEAGNPSVFTRVTSFAGWITQNTGIQI